MAPHSSILAWRLLMDRGAWWATVQRVAQSRTQLKRFSMHAHALLLGVVADPKNSIHFCPKGLLWE